MVLLLNKKFPLHKT